MHEYDIAIMAQGASLVREVEIAHSIRRIEEAELRARMLLVDFQEERRMRLQELHERMDLAERLRYSERRERLFFALWLVCGSAVALANLIVWISN